MKDNSFYGVRKSIWIALIVVILFYLYVEIGGGENVLMSILQQMQQFAQRHSGVF